MESVWVKQPTDSIYVKVPTNGGVNEIEGNYFGDICQPYTVNLMGTHTHTIKLPDASRYGLVPGNTFTIINNSTQSVTVNASDNSLVQSIDAGSTFKFTLDSVTVGPSGWLKANTSTNGSAIPGLPPVDPTPTDNSLVQRDAGGKVFASSFVGDVGRTVVNLVTTSASLKSKYFIDNADAGGIMITLPDETTCPVGQSTKFLNVGHDNIYISNVQGNVHTIPRFGAAEYTMVKADAGPYAWIGESSFCNTFDGPQPFLSFAQQYTYGAHIYHCDYAAFFDNDTLSNPPPNQVTSPYYYYMDASSPSNTVVCNWTSWNSLDGYSFYPVIFLPDASTVPIGSHYSIVVSVKTTEDTGARRLEVWTGASLDYQSELCLEMHDNILNVVCVSNDVTLGPSCWNITTSPAPSTGASSFDWLLTLIEIGLPFVLPGILGFAGKLAKQAVAQIGLIAKRIRAPPIISDPMFMYWTLPQDIKLVDCGLNRTTAVVNDHATLPLTLAKSVEEGGAVVAVVPPGGRGDLQFHRAGWTFVPH
jgi:hypothetical protein